MFIYFTPVSDKQRTKKIVQLDVLCIDCITNTISAEHGSDLCTPFLKHVCDGRVE